MRRPDVRGRLLWTALAVFSCFATPHARGGGLRSAWSRFVPGDAAAPSRLGTAGRPFAWSTAVGDLNGDGRLDYAVADRIGRDQAGFEYSVDLSITGGQAQRVTFSSPDAALSITLRDVDHDQDLDVVVSTILSPGVVRVWLNDGAGAFAEANPFELFHWVPAQSVQADSDGSTLTGVISTSRRARDALASAASRPTTDTFASQPAAASDTCPLSRPRGAWRARAPPSRPFLFL